MRATRRQFVAATAGLAALAGCSGEPTSGDGGGSSGGDGGPADGENGGERSGGNGTDPNGNNGDGGPSGTGSGPPAAEARLPLPDDPATLRAAAQSGGPPKDGIPSIDDPQFVDPDAADFLDPGDPVFGVARDGAVKAYPQKILVHHEVCNDVLGGTPVAVTYCPLTGTAQGFERGDTTFGVSGRLINANLVMYDRATETWWPQMLATSIPGPWNEEPPTRSLREFRLVWTTWDRWRGRHPETRVLSTETGHARNYGRDPYGRYNPRGGYYANHVTLFDPLNEDDRYDPKTVVMGARTPAGATAFHKDSLRDAGVLHGEIDGTRVDAVYDQRLDTAYAYRNPDEATVDVRDDGDASLDGETHAPDSLPLGPVYTFDAMWFAWAGYYPETSVHE